MNDLPKLPEGYRWRTIESHKIIFEHTESRKSYGVRTFGEEPLGGGCASEIAYGVAKIERELQRDREHCSEAEK